MATELVLIRHGHAVRVNGDYVQAPLTDLGRTQAELTGQYLCDQQFQLDGLYVSPIRRTKETAALIGSKSGHFPNVKNGVQELEGIEVPTLVLMEFLAHIGWFGHYLYVNVGKPITWPIMGRVSGVVTELLKQHEGGRFAIVTHSGVISSILAWYFPNRRRRWWMYVVDNCSFTRLVVSGTQAEIFVLDDTNHLSAALTTKQPPAGTVQVANKAEKKVEEIVLQKKTGETPKETPEETLKETPKETATK